MLSFLQCMSTRSIEQGIPDKTLFVSFISDKGLFVSFIPEKIRPVGGFPIKCIYARINSNYWSDHRILLNIRVIWVAHNLVFYTYPFFPKLVVLRRRRAS
jgi:hypothetical protein